MQRQHKNPANQDDTAHFANRVVQNKMKEHQHNVCVRKNFMGFIGVNCLQIHMANTSISHTSNWFHLNFIDVHRCFFCLFVFCYFYKGKNNGNNKFESVLFCSQSQQFLVCCFRGFMIIRNFYGYSNIYTVPNKHLFFKLHFINYIDVIRAVILDPLVIRYDDFFVCVCLLSRKNDSILRSLRITKSMTIGGRRKKQYKSIFRDLY